MRTRERIVDEILVLAAQAGQFEAFEDLARRWHPRLLRHATRLTDDAEAAREVTQEAWVAIARNLQRLHDPTSFAAWALRITGRRAADWISSRQKTRRRSTPLTDETSVEDRREDSRHDLALARDILRGLTPEQRALMAMFYLEGMTVAEIAIALAIPAGTVKSRLFNTREKLRAALEVPHEKRQQGR